MTVFKLILLLVSLGFVSGCNSDKEPVPTLVIYSDKGIDLSDDVLHFSAKGGEVELDIRSNSEWQIQSDESWLNFSAKQGSRNDIVTMTVAPTVTDRSAVVVVRLNKKPQVQCTFGVTQWCDNADDNADDNGDDDGDDSGDDNGGNSDGGGDDDNNDDNGNNGGSDDNGDNGDDNGNNGGGDDNGDDDGGNGDDNGDDNGNDDGGSVNNNSVYGEFGEVMNVNSLKEGVYYIGGRRGGELHLAIGGISDVGHCKTAVFEFDAEGNAVNGGGLSACEVELVAASNGYYLLFGDFGYLYATAARSGALACSAEPKYAWLFESHAEGGFVLQQASEESVKLVISPRASSDLLRSVGGLDEGGAVSLFILDRACWK